MRIAKHRGKEMIANRRALTYLKVLQMANLLARPVRLLNLPVLIMELKKDGAIKSGPQVIISVDIKRSGAIGLSTASEKAYSHLM